MNTQIVREMTTVGLEWIFDTRAPESGTTRKCRLLQITLASPDRNGADIMREHLGIKDKKATEEMAHRQIFDTLVHLPLARG